LKHGFDVTPKSLSKMIVGHLCLYDQRAYLILSKFMENGEDEDDPRAMWCCQKDGGGSIAKRFVLTVSVMPSNTIDKTVAVLL